METRANYALIGVFTLAVIATAFLFVYWFSGGDTGARRQPVRVVFSGSVLLELASDPVHCERDLRNERRFDNRSLGRLAAGRRSLGTRDGRCRRHRHGRGGADQQIPPGNVNVVGILHTRRSSL